VCWCVGGRGGRQVLGEGEGVDRLEVVTVYPGHGRWNWLGIAMITGRWACFGGRSDVTYLYEAVHVTTKSDG
jgi:hypothetical protein